MTASLPLRFATLAIAALACSAPRGAEPAEVSREVAMRVLRARGLDVAEFVVAEDPGHRYWRHQLELGNAEFFQQDPAFSRVVGSGRFEVVLCLRRPHDGQACLGGSFLILYCTDDPAQVFVNAEK